MNQNEKNPVAKALNRVAAAIVLLVVVMCGRWLLSEKPSDASTSVASPPPTTISTTAPKNNVTPAPVAPDPATISSLTSQWIQTWRAGAKNATPVPSSVKLYASSMHFDRDLADAYADFIESQGDSQGAIDDIHGSTAEVTMRYGLPTSNNGSIRFKIQGNIHFVHGSSGWQIDREWWYNRTVTGFRTPDGIIEDASNSKISGPQSIQYSLNGAQYEWTRLPKLSWKVVALATPTPQQTGSAETSVPVLPTREDNSGSTTSGYYGHPLQRSIPDQDAGCEDVSVSAVYDDGNILELDDGRRLRVDDADAPTSSVWVAPFDGLICNDDKFINKDENESVELQP